VSQIITITNLNDGIDVKNDPSAISEGGLQDCVGFDLTKEGLLETAQGLADNDLVGLLPIGDIQCMGVFYIGTTKYVLATTSSGLYANGVLIDVGFTGRFKALGLLNNIYLVNGVYARRFDGTSCYRWGITAPSIVPTFSTGVRLTIPLDNFENVTVWTANQVGCTVTANLVIFKEGTQSARFNVSAGATGYSVKAIPVDGTTFGSHVSTPDDYIRFWLYVDSFQNLSQLDISFDVGDGTFVDYFTYSLISPGLSQTMQLYSLGKTTEEVLGEDVLGKDYYRLVAEATAEANLSPKERAKRVKQVKKNKKKQEVEPTLVDQVLTYWRNSKLFQFKSATWHEIKVPKGLFVQVGNTTLGWNTVSIVKIKITATAAGAVNVYFDGLEICGGSDLVGDYWFLYAWGRQDASGTVIHESAPARNDSTKELIITGPVAFDRQPLAYGVRVPSTDPQVTCCIIYAIGGNLADFWEIAVISNNDVGAGTLYEVGDSFATRKLLTLDNEPAPPGTDLALCRNKVWMVGDPTYPTVLRSSDILEDGTLAPEAWPPRNGYTMSENAGNLLAVNVLNELLTVKGDFGEWVVRVTDPTDFLAVDSRRISDKGLVAQDGILIFETSHVYPSNRGFVETNAQSSKFILPEVEPLIDANISTAKGINAGLGSYFSYQTTASGTRTAKVDLYRGKPRFSNINNKLFDWFYFDAKNDKLYGVTSGGVYLVESGYIDASSPGQELQALLKSRAFRPGKPVVWNRMDFYHNTGGVWYRIDIYIDGALRGFQTFQSSSRTNTNFRFGPWTGLEFQFVLTANYNAKGIIYFPIRIYHSD